MGREDVTIHGEAAERFRECLEDLEETRGFTVSKAEFQRRLLERWERTGGADRVPILEGRREDRDGRQ